MDKLATCKFPYSTKTVTTIFELLKCNVPYDTIRHIWDYYELVPPGLFDNTMQINWHSMFHRTYTTPECKNVFGYKNNLIYINMKNIITKFDGKGGKDGKIITLQISNIKDDDFYAYLQNFDEYMIKKMSDENKLNYRYDLCRNSNEFRFEVKKSQIHFYDTPYVDYFKFVKNLSGVFRICIMRNDNIKKYMIVFKMKTIDNIELK